MSFDLPQMHVPDNSPETKAVQSVMATQHVGVEGAVRAILRNAADKRTPAQRMIGLLSRDEDVVIMNEVSELVAESRRTQTTRDIGI